MTEDEAKQKVCWRTFGVPDERDENGCGIREGGPWKCLGSGCMAWVETAVTRDVLDNGAIAEPGTIYRRSSVVKQVRHVTGGYCALLCAPR